MYTAGRVRKESGVVLLIFVVIIVSFYAANFLAKAQHNSIAHERAQKNTALLSEVKMALEGYALTQEPPGLLPCPDQDGDGFADIAGSGCVVTRGLVPHKTLNLTANRDAYGGFIWYAVSDRYVRASAGNRLNSSLASNIVVDSVPKAAVLIASGEAVSGQVRNEVAGALNAAQYLEGANGDGDGTTYSEINVNGANDQVLAISLARFWGRVERRVLGEVGRAIRAYRDVPGCAQLPFASSDVTDPFNSTLGVTYGSVPFGVTISYAVNPSCPLTLSLPNWVRDNWSGELSLELCAPPGALDCLTVLGETSMAARLVILAPGVPLLSQVRPSLDRSDYAEEENRTIDQQYRLLEFYSHGEQFNDNLYILYP